MYYYSFPDRLIITMLESNSVHNVYNYESEVLVFGRGIFKSC